MVYASRQYSIAGGEREGSWLAGGTIVVFIYMQLKVRLVFDIGVLLVYEVFYERAHEHSALFGQLQHIF